MQRFDKITFKAKKISNKMWIFRQKKETLCDPWGQLYSMKNLHLHNISSYRKWFINELLKEFR